MDTSIANIIIQVEICEKDIENSADATRQKIETRCNEKEIIIFN